MAFKIFTVVADMKASIRKRFPPAKIEGKETFSTKIMTTSINLNSEAMKPIHHKSNAFKIVNPISKRNTHRNT